jgi:molybdate transport system substrate-binding protein
MKCLLLATLLGMIFSTQAAMVRVFAAASLTDVLKSIAADYERSTGDKVVFNFAASSFLARQIAEGAPADVFFSADEAKMDELAAKNLLLPGTRTNLLGNTLVVVVPRDSRAPVQNAADLLHLKRVAIAEPRTVPAGIYAREYLTARSLWEPLGKRVVPTENVRAALAALEAGNADAAIVYKTDAAMSQKVRVAFEVPRPEGPTITYPVGVLKKTKESAAAQRFVNFLSSHAARKAFASFGFIVLQSGE